MAPWCRHPVFAMYYPGNPRIEDRSGNPPSGRDRSPQHDANYPFRGKCQRCKNPPNYTVLNAAQKRHFCPPHRGRGGYPVPGSQGCNFAPGKDKSRFVSSPDTPILPPIIDYLDVTPYIIDDYDCIGPQKFFLRSSHTSLAYVRGVPPPEFFSTVIRYKFIFFF